MSMRSKWNMPFAILVYLGWTLFVCKRGMEHCHERDDDLSVQHKSSFRAQMCSPDSRHAQLFHSFLPEVPVTVACQKLVSQPPLSSDIMSLVPFILPAVQKRPFASSPYPNPLIRHFDHAKHTQRWHYTHFLGAVDSSGQLQHSISTIAERR